MVNQQLARIYCTYSIINIENTSAECLPIIPELGIVYQIKEENQT